MTPCSLVIGWERLPTTWPWKWHKKKKTFQDPFQKWVQTERCMKITKGTRNKLVQVVVTLTHGEKTAEPLQTPKPNYNQRVSIKHSFWRRAEPERNDEKRTISITGMEKFSPMNSLQYLEANEVTMQSDLAWKVTVRWFTTQTLPTSRHNVEQILLRIRNDVLL